MHPFQYAKREGVPAQLLRKQNLLRDIAEEHSSNRSATGEVRFRSAEHRDLSSNGWRCSPGSRRGSIVGFFQRRLRRAFAGAARAHLHSPHLIRRA
jgi:hypothetical protein